MQNMQNEVRFQRDEKRTECTQYLSVSTWIFLIHVVSFGAYSLVSPIFFSFAIFSFCDAGCFISTQNEFFTFCVHLQWDAAVYVFIEMQTSSVRQRKQRNENLYVIMVYCYSSRTFSLALSIEHERAKNFQKEIRIRSSAVFSGLAMGI